MTWATAPAIATDVASTTLPVVRYSVRNTMVERKSVASLANTSFIVVLHWDVSRHREEQSDEAIQSFLMLLDCFAALAMTFLIAHRRKRRICSAGIRDTIW